MKEIKYSCSIPRPEQYKLLSDKPYPFPKNGGDTYYWHLVNFTPDVPKEKVVLVFKLVMEKWQSGFDIIPPVGRHLKLESTSDIEKADFIFSFGDIFHKIPHGEGQIDCPFPFDGVGGVLAHAFAYETVAPYGGQCHFDESEHWSEMHGTKEGKIHTHLLTVALHETGHIVGAGHSELREAVMYPSYTGIKENLHDDDLNALKQKLGPVKLEIYNRSNTTPPLDECFSFWGSILRALGIS